MKSKVIVLTITATFSLSGLALAQDAAVNMVASPTPVVDQAQPAAVVVGNTKCPACGMEIPAADLGKYTVEYNGKVYNVCSPNDKDMFMAQLDRYGKIAETGHDPLSDPIPPLNAAAQAESAAPAAEQK
jgi:YHS domain-containing protein